MQRGFGGFLAMLLIAGLAATAGLFTFYRADAVQLENDRVTGEALVTAKAALVAYAVSRGGPTGRARPGDLPCPDVTGDGIADTPCRTTSTLLGRIPWKTLNIAEPKDGAGETLWYALSANFREFDSWPLATSEAARSVNSDSRGTLTVRASNGTVLTNEAVAVIFAPGTPISGQNRGVAGVTCAITNLLGSPRLCPTNYLESATGLVNLNSYDGPFTAADRSDTVNDRLMFLNTNELIPAVEMRVGNEMRYMLEQYRANAPCQCYPWADTWEYSGGIADSGQNRGRFPSILYPDDHNWGYSDGTYRIPALPEWLVDNNWHNLVWYSVSWQNTHGGGTACRTCSDPAYSPMLTVDGTPVSALVITPGPPPDGQARITSVSRRDNISLYFEDEANRDGSYGANCRDTGEIGYSTSTALIRGVPNCDRYTAPAETRYNRDRLFMVGVAGPGICVPGARAMLDYIDDNGSCGWPNVSPVCAGAVANLDSCTCLDAARKLARPPCANGLNPPQCEAAKAQLEACRL